MPHLPDRQSHRWDRHEYTADGYFVTICTHERRRLFGAVVDETTRLNEFGEIARQEWVKSEEIRDEVELDEFIIMPNHMHAIVWIVGAHGRAPNESNTIDERTGGRRPPLRLPQSLGSLIAGYKSAVTRRINRRRDTRGAPVWQRNYYEN